LGRPLGPALPFKAMPDSGVDTSGGKGGARGSAEV